MSTRLQDVRRLTGQAGEAAAGQYLERSLGWTIVARNWRCRRGELDIVGFDDGVLVAVEVRTRSGRSSDDALCSINGVKRARLRRLARRFAAVELGFTDDCLPMRVDVIALAMENGVVLELVHLRGAVDDDS